MWFACFTMVMMHTIPDCFVTCNCTSFLQPCLYHHHHFSAGNTETQHVTTSFRAELERRSLLSRDRCKASEHSRRVGVAWLDTSLLTRLRGGMFPFRFPIAFDNVSASSGKGGRLQWRSVLLVEAEVRSLPLRRMTAMWHIRRDIHGFALLPLYLPDHHQSPHTPGLLSRCTIPAAVVASEARAGVTRRPKGEQVVQYGK